MIDGEGPAAEPTIDYTLGVDLGQAADFSAACVIERTSPPIGDSTFMVRHLHRWPLGTGYSAIAHDVADLAYEPALGRPRVAIDKTGVGAAVSEMVAAALTAKAKAGNGKRVHLVPILITGGHAATRQADGSWHVSKVLLVSVLQALLSSGRLKIAADMPDAGTLIKELKGFKARITTAGNETFAADWRTAAHSDLVLSLACGCWLAENCPARRPRIVTGGATVNPRHGWPQSVGSQF